MAKNESQSAASGLMTPAPPRQRGAWPIIVTTRELHDGNIGSEVFLAESISRGYRFTRAENWLTDRKPLEPRLAGCQVLYLAEYDDRVDTVLGMDDVLIDLTVMPQRDNTGVHVRVSATTQSAMTAAFEWLARELPRMAEKEEARVRVRFWACGTDGRPDIVERFLEAPTWDEIGNNYPSRTAAGLRTFMTNLESVARRGRLILWHGAPGTGKTYAIKALGRSYLKSASIDYITDPEMLFGGTANYLLRSVLAAASDRERKWRILVVEDADELISVDAKQRAGQGLSRLLNVVDGFIGAGLGLLVLLTTNESIKSFHPAVVRPGRCGSLVEFETFTTEAAKKWHASRGADAGSTAGNMTLAELYSTAGGDHSTAGKRRIGFSPS